jgi:predicted AAA+ superfamily ATPase
LIERGGFPEAFLAKTNSDAKKWREQYIDGLIREDVLDFERIYDFKAIQAVLNLLRRRVGSPVSYSSIASDVGISPTTARKYMQIFEALFITFSIRPYSKNIARSLSKEPKICFFDVGMVIGDDGVKFENFVALSLLTDVIGHRDNLGENNSLKYLRTKNGKETDFCIVDENYEKIKEIIEAKNAKFSLDKNLEYFSTKYDLKAKQVVRYLKYDRYISDKIQIIQSEKFMEQLQY